MIHTRVLTNTISDNTGKITEIPILLIEKDGEIDPLWSLHRYLMKNFTRSISWQNKLIQAVGLLLDYMEANNDCFPNPKDLFKSFTDAVYAGTINENGSDPSGLFWLPRRTKTARQLLVPLSIFSDWMHTEYGSIPLNPWREATTHEERLNWAALIQKSHRSFLGHLDDYSKMSETAKKARTVMDRRIPTGDYGDVKAFPDDDTILNLLWVGFKKSNKENNFLKQYNWRDIAITILMHGGGLRESEPFHLWVHDVMAEPSDPTYARVRVYHPSEGDAPKDFKMPDGRYLTNRKSYLGMKYSLLPRNEYRGMRHAGWKNPKLSDSQQYYIHVHWFPRDWGYLFMQVWKMYLAQRIYEKITDTHPFAFVSFRGDNHGDMYTIESFRQSHARAVRRIGLTVGKMHGTTEHGHRHAYGQRTSKAKLDPSVTQAGLHHKARESQDVYTQPTIDRVTKVLAKASEALENGQQLPMVVDLDAWFNQERKMQKYWITRRRKYK